MSTLQGELNRLLWQTLIEDHEGMEHAILLLESVDLVAIVAPVSESFSSVLVPHKAGHELEVLPSTADLAMHTVHANGTWAGIFCIVSGR